MGAVARIRAGRSGWLMIVCCGAGNSAERRSCCRNDDHEPPPKGPPCGSAVIPVPAEEPHPTAIMNSSDFHDHRDVPLSVPTATNDEAVGRAGTAGHEIDHHAIKIAESVSSPCSLGARVHGGFTLSLIMDRVGPTEAEERRRPAAQRRNPAPTATTCTPSVTGAWRDWPKRPAVMKRSAPALSPLSRLNSDQLRDRPECRTCSYRSRAGSRLRRRDGVTRFGFAGGRPGGRRSTGARPPRYR